jgi:hypothetical protein
VTPDGSHVVYSSSSGATDLYAADTTTSQVTSLLASSLPAGATVQYPQLSSNGQAVLYMAYVSGKTGCAGQTWVLTTIDGTSPVLLADDAACSVQNVVMTPDGTTLVYQKGSALFATTGTSPTALSTSSEQVIQFWISPATNLIVVETIASGQFAFYATHATGSPRTSLGSPLPFDKHLYDVKFAKQGTTVLVDIDAVTDGVLELFRFDPM